jgi:hypothetical protein
VGVAPKGGAGYRRHEVNGGMKLERFPAEKLQPLKGSIRGHIFQNEAIAIPLTLFHEITVPLAPFELAGKTVKTDLRLGFIRFGVSKLRELSGRMFAFPANPVEGYVDGSIYLCDVHSPVDLPRIIFGNVATAVPAEMDLRVLFELEQTGFENADVHLTVELAYEGVVLRASSVDDALRLAERLIDPADYRPPVKEGRVYRFQPG